MAIILTQENCEDYFEKQIMPSLPFEVKKLIDIEEISEHTNVNWIFRADLETDKDNRSVYLRQSRGFVKKKPEMALEADRIAFEVKILKYLNELQPGVNPDVLYFDKKNNVCVLSDIKRGGKLLVKELVAGNPHIGAAERFGQIIAKFHGQTFGVDVEQFGRSEKANVEWKAFHIGMRDEPALKEFPKETNEFLEVSKQAPQCLVLGDLASKNIFVDGEEIRFLDLERAFVGDPAFDIAFLFCHYLLEIPFEKVNLSIEFIDKFMESYGETMKKYISDEEMTALDNRIIRWLGIMILYRLFGFYLAIETNQNGQKWKEIAYKLLVEEKEYFVTKKLKELI